MTSLPRLLHVTINGKESGGLERYIGLRAERETGYQHYLFALDQVQAEYSTLFSNHYSSDSRNSSVDLEKCISRDKPDCLIVYNSFYLLEIALQLADGHIPIIFSAHDYSAVSVGTGYNRFTLKNNPNPLLYLPIKRDFITRKISFFTKRELSKSLTLLGRTTAIEAPGDTFAGILASMTTAHVFTVPPHCFSNSTSQSYPDGSNLLFVGSLTRGKGIRLLMKSLNKVTTHYQLTVVGSGYLKSEIISWSSKRNIQLTLRDRVNQSELHSHYQASTLVVVPSILESFGMVSLEAMAHSRCVIGFAVPGHTDQITNEVNGFLVTPFNTQQYAERITKALNSPTLRSCIEEKAYVTATTRFSSKLVTQRFTELMEHCAVH